jgi:type II secretory pathway pseudopilin PulG
VGYSLLLAAAAMIVCMLAAVSISVSASNRAIHQAEVQRQTQQAQVQQAYEAQQKQAKRAACLVIVSQDDALHEPGSEPITEAGKRTANAWRNLRKVFQCDKE